MIKISKELFIIKIGGSLVTFKNRLVPRLNEENIRRFGQEFSKLIENRKFILIHGAGSYGHPTAYLLKHIKGNKERGISEVQILENQLNVDFCNILLDYNIPVFPFQPSTISSMKDGKLVKLYSEVLEKITELGFIPVLYGVPSFDETKGMSILSGDEIMRKLAELLKPKRIIHLTDVDGIYDKNPKKYSDAKLIREITRENIKEVMDLIEESSNVDVSGGMKKKIEEIFEINGIEAVITNGLKEGNLTKAVEGERVGTIIKT